MILCLSINLKLIEKQLCLLLACMVTGLFMLSPIAQVLKVGYVEKSACPFYAGVPPVMRSS